MSEFQMSTHDTMSILSKYNFIQKHDLKNLKLNFEKNE